MKPMYIEQVPMSSKRYLAGSALYKRDLGPIYSFITHRYTANQNINEPWPISPNIIPNRNGNVKILNKVGFASL